MALTPMILRDEKLLSKILADQKPFWEPGKFQGYHAWTIALYQNEILKRIDPKGCLLYTSPSPRDRTRSRMPSSA